MDWYQFAVFLHVIGAVGLGYYLIIPFMLLRARTMPDTHKEHYLFGLYSPSRILQYLLIAQLVTGGYMMSQRDYTVLWMTLMGVFFLLVAALSGILNGRIKKAARALAAGGDGRKEFKSAQTLGWIVFVNLLIVLYFMLYPIYG